MTMETTELIEACLVDDVPEGQMRRLSLDRIDVAVAVAKIDGKVFAFEDRCTHGEASLAEDGVIVGLAVECGWHCGQFDIQTGKAIASPCMIDLRTFEVVVKDGRVFLKPPFQS